MFLICGVSDLEGDAAAGGFRIGGHLEHLRQQAVIVVVIGRVAVLGGEIGGGGLQIEGAIIGLDLAAFRKIGGHGA